jgi:hypothetical protein
LWLSEIPCKPMVTIKRCLPGKITGSCHRRGIRPLQAAYGLGPSNNCRSTSQSALVTDSSSISRQQSVHNQISTCASPGEHATFRVHSPVKQQAEKIKSAFNACSESTQWQSMKVREVKPPSLPVKRILALVERDSR